MQIINYFLDSINLYLFKIYKIFDRTTYNILVNICDYDENPNIQLYVKKDIES